METFTKSAKLSKPDFSNTGKKKINLEGTKPAKYALLKSIDYNRKIMMYRRLYDKVPITSILQQYCGKIIYQKHFVCFFSSLRFCSTRSETEDDVHFNSDLEKMLLLGLKRKADCRPLFPDLFPLKV